MNKSFDRKEYNNKAVWIIWQRQHFLFNEFKKTNYTVFDPFIGYNRIVPRFFRIIHFSSKIPFKNIWYRELPHNKPRLIVIREGIITEDYLRWLRKKIGDTKVIVIFMNKITRKSEVELAKRFNCEVDTGDPLDCILYGMTPSHSAVYLRHLKIKKEKPMYDVFYAGSAKPGRLKVLDEVCNLLVLSGLTIKKYITSPYPYGITFGKYMKKMSYSNLLNEMSDTRAILHLKEGASTGITMRVVESVINEIKLITNDEMIVDTPIYNRENVFILGKDDLGEITDFLDRPFVSIDSKIIESFFFETWVEKDFITKKIE